MPSSNISGAEKRFINIAYFLLKRGNVDLVFSISETAYQKACGNENVRNRLNFIKNSGALYCFTNYFDKTVGILSKLYSILVLLYFTVKIRPKIIHTTLWTYYALGVFKLFNTKIVYEITSPDNVDNIVKLPLFLLKFIDIKVCVSHSVFDRFVEKTTDKRIQYDDFRVASIPLYIPFDGVNINNKENIITYCSRFINRKNPILFLKAGLRIIEKYSDYRIIMLGDGELKSQLESMAQNSNKTDRIEIYRTKDTHSVFEKSKIYVTLITPDNVPSQAALEAIDCGNYIVSSNTGHSSIFVSNNNGTLVPLQEDALFNALEEAIKLVSIDMHRIAKKSKEIINRDFHVDKYILQVESYYAELDN